MEGRQIVQWDKDSCADAGFLKIDLLGLGMLSAVERCVEEIARTRGEPIDLSRIPYDDPEVYAQIQARARPPGVFQIESRAQMQMLQRTLPEYARRPHRAGGARAARADPSAAPCTPTSSGARRCAPTPPYEVPYEHPSLEPVLRDTLGAIVFQDQVIEVAMAFAGFTPGRGRGAAPRDEPQRAPRRPCAPTRRSSSTGAMARGRRREHGRAGVRPDRGLLGLRLPQGALGGVRAARLPVHLAARALRPRVPVRAAERAADGLLPAGRAGARGPAAGHRGAATGRAGRRAHAECRGGGLARVRIGLGVRQRACGEEDVRELVAERERGGPFGRWPIWPARCAAQRGGARAARVGGARATGSWAGRRARRRGAVAARRGGARA